MLVFISYTVIVLGLCFVIAVSGKQISTMYYNSVIYRNQRKDYLTNNVFTFQNIFVGVIIFLLTTTLSAMVNPKYLKSDTWNEVYDITRQVFTVGALASCVVGFIFKGYLRPNTLATKRTYKIYMFTEMGLLLSYQMLILPILFISFLAVYLR